MGLLIAAAALAEPVSVDGLPMTVQAGDGWRASVRGAGALTVARDAPPTEFALEFERGVQLDFARVRPEVARGLLEAELASVGAHLQWGEVAVDRVAHPSLGSVFVLATDGRVAGGADPVRMRFATWAGPAGRVVLGGGVYADPARADALFAEALDRLAWREAPIPPDGFTWGRAEIDGYALDLPDGWRLAHPAEGLAREGQALALDPGTPGGEGVACVTNREPLEVIAPDRSPGHASRFVARARALLAGGGPTLRAPPRPAVRVGADGALERVRLGDRDGYLWRASGEAGEAVALVYTTAGDRGVDCVYAAPDVPDAVETALLSLRITDGAPQYRTWMGEYMSRWPFRHPLLQAWWLGAALLAAAVALGIRRLR